jgi:hypothetical protein
VSGQATGEERCHEDGRLPNIADIKAGEYAMILHSGVGRASVVRKREGNRRNVLTEGEQQGTLTE